eukprot:TRINITY_DN669_c0_g1_i1.p1 TRINITY_DN669_c0_g1~~TRINITY_DN669_c0_g1_i1.p1  ORF type:complete len:279 (+),score=107.33 TRINITY_DN669_c0_g1_i1:59-838(+)
MSRVFCLLVIALACVYAQVPIPPRYDGFAQGSPSSPIQLEAFFDLLCPDCKQAWPNVKQVLSYYNAPNQPSNIRFYLHTFPLPYHHNAFFAAQGAHIVLQNTNSNVSKVFDWVDAIFDAQDYFSGSATATITPNEVLNEFGNVAQKVLGIPQATFVQAYNANTDYPTRVSWKYGCSRGVSGTPTFLVNGVQVQADPSWGLTEWRQVIDPLLSQTPTFTSTSSSSVHTCPSGYPTCQYLPGKFECCKPGESCIPNVGCRC